VFPSVIRVVLLGCSPRIVVLLVFRLRDDGAGSDVSPNHHIWCSSVSIPLDNHHISCGDEGVITAASFDARKPLRRKSTQMRDEFESVPRTGWSQPRDGSLPGSQVREVRLRAQPRPSSRLGGTRRRHDADDSTRAAELGFGVPHDLEVFESTVATPHVVLPVVERRPPTGPLQLAAVVLLHLSVLSMLALRTEDSSTGTVAGGHGSIVNDSPCEVLVAQRCEFCS
jgi:hypothetical protein